MRTNGGDDHAAGEEEKGETEEEQDNRENSEPVFSVVLLSLRLFPVRPPPVPLFPPLAPLALPKKKILPFFWLDLIGVRPWEVWGLAVIKVLLGRPPAGVRVQGGAHKYVPEV